MRRFWAGQNASKHDHGWSLSGDVFHHVIEVCRMQVGNRFELLTTEKTAYLVELTQISKKTAEAKTISERAMQLPKGPRVHLCLSIPKFPTLESVIEKSVELGVASIRPFFSEFSFIRTADKLSVERLKRWEKIVLSATQQSNRGDIMSIVPAQSLKDLLINLPTEGRGLFCYEGVSALGLREAIGTWSPQEPQADIWVFIGSEGGFSDREVQLFQQHGLNSVTLGEQILRVETACLAVISIIKYQMKVYG